MPWKLEQQCVVQCTEPIMRRLYLVTFWQITNLWNTWWSKTMNARGLWMVITRQYEARQCKGRDPISNIWLKQGYCQMMLMLMLMMLMMLTMMMTLLITLANPTSFVPSISRLFTGGAWKPPIHMPALHDIWPDTDTRDIWRRHIWHVRYMPPWRPPLDMCETHEIIKKKILPFICRSSHDIWPHTDIRDICMTGEPYDI